MNKGFTLKNYLTNIKMFVSLIIVLLLVSNNIKGQTVMQYAAADTNTLKADLIAGTYDIYELTEPGGLYVFRSTSSTAILLTKSVTIRALSGLTAKPIISVTNTSASSTQGIFCPNVTDLTLTMEGLEFDGINKNIAATSQPILVRATATAPNCKVVVKDCYIHDFLNLAGNGTIRLDATGSSMDIQGTVFNNCNGRVLYFASADGNNSTMINDITNGDLTIKNCTFSNTTVITPNANNLIHYKSGSGIWAKGKNATIDHCTFYNFVTTGTSETIFKFRLMSGEIRITNCIFDKIANGFSFSQPTPIIDFCYLDGFDTPPTGTNSFTTTPSFTDVASLNFGLTNRTSFTCDDGYTAGNTIYYPVAPKLPAPVVGNGTNPTVDGFTANWSKVENASGYTVKVYQGTELVSSISVDEQVTESLLITGLTTGTEYSYKVSAKGDAINYISSDLSTSSAVIKTLGLTPPLVGEASNITSEGYTANWTAVTGANGYDVLTFFQTTLISTNNVSGQSTSSLAISGLSQGNSYTFKVVAIGNGTNVFTSSPSIASNLFVTIPIPVDFINTNFGDSTWGLVIPPPTTNLPPVFYNMYINGFGLIDAILYGSTPTGLSGEVHTNVMRLRNNVNSKLEFPTVNSLEQIEIHISGADLKGFFLKEFDGVATWNNIQYNGNDTLKLVGTTENVFRIPISRTTPRKFRIDNGSTSSLNVHQIITRKTNPTILATPTVGTASDTTGSGFTAHWTPNDIHATGYKIFVYATDQMGATALRNTFIAEGPATTSFAVTGIDTAAICTYKVTALGDGGVLYLDSYISAASLPFSIERLSTPVISEATNITSSGFTANWTPVTEALGYNILVYNDINLISTLSLTNPNDNSIVVTGLTTNAVYYYTVIAKGDGTLTFDSKESIPSSNILVVPLTTLPTATLITTVGATLGGTIESGATIIARGTVWGEMANPIDNPLAEGGTDAGTFTQIRTGMIPNSFYFYRAYATFSAGTGYSADGSFTTLSLAPQIAAATNIFAKEFTINWVAPISQGNAVYTYTLEVSTTNDFSANVLSFSDISSTLLSKQVIGLTPGTIYYCRVMAVNAGGNSDYSGITSVLTLPEGLPELLAAAATQITASGAKLGGTIIKSLTPIKARGTVWGTSPNPSSNALVEGGTTVAEFSHVRTGMNANTYYYYRAYAINDVGTGYSRDCTFITLSLPPVIASETNINSTGFTANWSAPIGQGTEAYTYTLEVSPDISFATGVISEENIMSDIFSKEVIGLVASTNYYYRLMINNASGNSAYSNKEIVKTAVATPPVLELPTAAFITATSAELGATIISNGGAPILERGTYWGKEIDPTENIMAEGGTNMGSFSHQRTGMVPNTSYHFRAYAKNNAAVGYSKDSIFTTLSLPATISNASKIGTSGFAANWSAPATQGSESFTYSLEISTDSNFTEVITTVDGITTLSKVITGLKNSTNYFYRVQVVNGGGKSDYTDFASVKTLSFADAPTVSLITPYGATLGGTVLANGDALPLARGTLWGTSESPTENMLAEGGTSTGVFSHMRTGMVPNTKYHFRAYATYGSETGYSIDSSFTTLSLAPKIADATNISETGFTANWIAPLAQGQESFVYTVEVSRDQTFATGVFSSPDISSDILYYVLSDMNPSTNYYYRVRARNAGGYSIYSASAKVNTVYTGLSDMDEGNALISFFPNPVANALNVNYTLLENTNVTLAIYSIEGKIISTLINNQNQVSGSYSTSFDMTDYKNGIYFGRFTTGNSVELIKIVIDK